MFGLFKKKSEKDKLYEKYQKLTQEAFNLSTSNRKLSDQKTAEAEAIMKQIEAL
ncbi:Lacal_2735 family protein [Kordia sp.]|uniref:Lacal_2735 family protein n=1 Tax=Kordia sp. TaxID=1965332 RepID=UPI0025C4A381|nr:Lacal_2735 family protein [Kordia sp.]MCH2195525.1 Lacal_2735 family protein [Kordia sp.]